MKYTLHKSKIGDELFIYKNNVFFMSLYVTKELAQQILDGLNEGTILI
jgi:hypothetical protein